MNDFATGAQDIPVPMVKLNNAEGATVDLATLNLEYRGASDNAWMPWTEEAARTLTGGSYTLRASKAEASDANYYPAIGSTNFNVIKKDPLPPFTVQMDNYTYLAPSPVPTVSGLPEGVGELSYTYGTKADGSDAKPLDLDTTGRLKPDTYYLFAKVAESDQYLSGQTTTTFTVHKKAVTVHIEMQSFTYGTPNSGIPKPVITQSPSSTNLFITLTFGKQGEEPILSWDDADKSKLNAGTYTLKATPTENDYYTANAATTTFTVGKATPILSVDPASLFIDKGAAGETTIEYRGDGVISATSSNAGVATAELKGNMLAITGISAGTATITVNAAAGNNYSEATPAVLNVTVHEHQWSFAAEGATITAACASDECTIADKSGGSVTVLAPQAAEAGEPLVYTGAPFAASIENKLHNSILPPAISYECLDGEEWLPLNGAADVVDAGTYRAVIKATDLSGSMPAKATAYIEFEITKAAVVDNTTLGMGNYVYGAYNASEHAPALTPAVDASKVTYEYRPADSESAWTAWSDELANTLNAGSYVMRAVVAGDTNHNSVTLEDAFAVTNAPQAAPAAPVVEAWTHNSATLKEVEGCEYSKDGGLTWQDSSVFEGLDSGAEYSFVQRLAAKTNYDTSPMSAAATQTTDAIFTVTYAANGAEGEAPAAQAYIERSDALTVASPQNLAKTGYTFAGWNTKANGVDGTAYQPGAELVPTGNLTLYAQWTPISYELTFNANRGEGVGTGAMDAMNLTYDVEATLPACAFTREGYTFRAWSLQPADDTEYAAGTAVKNLSATDGATVTLYAQWTENGKVGIAANLHGVTAQLPQEVRQYESITGTFALLPDYIAPIVLSVTVEPATGDGASALADPVVLDPALYTFDAATGTLAIPAEHVSGRVTVTATAKMGWYEDNKVNLNDALEAETSADIDRDALEDIVSKWGDLSDKQKDKVADELNRDGITNPATSNPWTKDEITDHLDELLKDQFESDHKDELDAIDKLGPKDPAYPDASDEIDKAKDDFDALTPGAQDKVDEGTKDKLDDLTGAKDFIENNRDLIDADTVTKDDKPTLDEVLGTDDSGEDPDNPGGTPGKVDNLTDGEKDLIKDVLDDLQNKQDAADFLNKNDELIGKVEDGSATKDDLDELKDLLDGLSKLDPEVAGKIDAGLTDKVTEQVETIEKQIAEEEARKQAEAEAEVKRKAEEEAARAAEAEKSKLESLASTGDNVRLPIALCVSICIAIITMMLALRARPKNRR